MYYTVYKITNEINGKIYVGVHQTEDLNDDYMGSGALIKKAIRKYGKENFNKEYLKICDDPESMFLMETELVTSEFVLREDTYNMKEGGLGGDTSKHIDYGDEYKRNISDAMIKMFNENPDIRKEYADRLRLVRHSFAGKSHTEETKKKIGEANSKHQSGKGNSQYGKCWIHSLTAKVNKKIMKTELTSYLNEGWIKGRKMKF
jgi:group I intron endonuclease